MRDKNYFDSKMFGFTNSELKTKLSRIAAEKNLPVYLVVDEALRVYAQKQGKEILIKPKIPTMI